ncbi:MAG: methyltransferase family protein [Candidatus Hodarchaeota archaeon]
MVAQKKHSHHARDRDDLTKEHPWCDRGQLILLIVYIATWILDSLVFQLTTFISNFVPAVLQWILTIAFVILGIYLLKASHDIVFGERRDPPVVIEKGVFKLVRHPMYLGGIFMYVGLFFGSFSLLCLALLVVVIVFYDMFAGYEEKKLEEKYGQAYVDYKKRVPRWLPRLKK